MARGRPRKQGQRFPSGKLRPEKKVQTVIHAQREREVLRTAAKSSLLGTPIGELFREEKITATQYTAAERFAEARAAADAALSLPPRSPTAQDMNALGGLSAANDDEEAARRKRRTVTAYEKARDTLDLISFAAVEWVVIQERRPDDYTQRIALIAGLNRLVAHYGIKG